jgi:hypothetical protein
MKNNVIKIKSIHDLPPTDVAISIHIQNLFATYGEARVKESLKDLFNLKFIDQKPKNKKAAV